MLAVMIERSKHLDLFEGLVPHVVDDTILFLDDDLEKAKNLKLVLCAFEKLTGFKINFHKSEFFSFRETKERVREYVELFGCKEGAWPLVIWEFQLAPASLQIKTREGWRNDSRKNSVVGKASCCHMGEGLC
jgi:hypothetical protein